MNRTCSKAKGEVVRALASLLERLVGEIAKLSSRVERAVAEMPDGKIVMSFPRTGRINAAQILAELGDVRERFPTELLVPAVFLAARPLGHLAGQTAA